MTRKTVWRHIPLDKLMAKRSSRNILKNLYKAGYHTAGDVIDATPEELGANVYGLGVRRAQQLRRHVIEQVCPPLIVSHVGIDERAPAISLSDVLLGCVITAVFMATVWALMVMTP